MELWWCEHARFQISYAGLNTLQTRKNQAKSRLNVHQVMPKTQREARAKRSENYLAGQARRPHTHLRTLGVALDESKVEEKQLAEYVIMPSGVDSFFKARWRATDPLASVAMCGKPQIRLN